MRFILDINYPIEKIEQNRRRMEARLDFDYTDRVPVGFCLVPRYFAPVFGVEYKDFFKDVETQFHLQLEFAKYRMENVPEDTLGSPVVTVFPYFDNVINADALGAEISWPDNETPRAIPTIKTPDDANRYEIPDPTSGLWGKVLDWHFRMKELAEETVVTFNGQPGKVEVAPPSIGGEGPHMMAIDLVGDDFYWWMAECPETCHRLLDKITKAMIGAEEHFRKVVPGVRGGFGLAEDSAQIMSADMFREFCIPYDSALYDRFGAGLKDGRGMHMCGDSIHLHQALVDDLHISSLNVFGYMVPPKVAARNFGGKAYLWGNVNPMLMLQGSKEEVKAEAMRCLNGMAPCGGFMLGDGANVCPGTPLENLAVLTEASEEYGRPLKD
jgi:uroporphyrinogen-III decarboxylase